MGKRISKVYTRTGDDGTTGIVGNKRLPKQSTRIEAIGEVDELNCEIGLILAEGDVPDAVRNLLSRIQHQLFDLGGELSMPPHAVIKPEHVSSLESVMDRINAKLPTLANFILPGGSRVAAQAHKARAVARRAERQLARLVEEENVFQNEGAVNAESLRYLNRLSDLLFVVARYLNVEAEVPEVLWAQQKPAA